MASKGVLVFDSSPLVHFARADKLAVLRSLVNEFECVTTKAVLGELRTGITLHPITAAALDLEWLATVRDLIKGLADTDARFPRAARDDLFAWAREQHPPLL